MSSLARVIADLREEGDELHALLVPLRESDWARPTPFKGWTVAEVVQHLHDSDHLAVLALRSPDEFRERLRRASSGALQREPLAPPELLRSWREFYLQMCDLLAAADPNQRVPWAGPDMGVRMFATARQMETWAHGQDIYDLLGVRRTATDRLENIAVIGVRTFGWTFANRGLEPPGAPPYVRLTAPSGATWEWNEPSDDNRVEGLAVEFCHVVTQGRNLADTSLRVTGEAATRWMAIAQCFAGPPEDPPKPGERA